MPRIDSISFTVSRPPSNPITPPDAVWTITPGQPDVLITTVAEAGPFTDLSKTSVRFPVPCMGHRTIADTRGGALLMTAATFETRTASVTVTGPYMLWSVTAARVCAISDATSTVEPGGMALPLEPCRGGGVNIDPVVGPVVTGAGTVGGPGTAVALVDGDEDGPPADNVVPETRAQPVMASVPRANAAARTPIRRETWDRAR